MWINFPVRLKFQEIKTWAQKFWRETFLTNSNKKNLNEIFFAENSEFFCCEFIALVSGNGGAFAASRPLGRGFDSCSRCPLRVCFTKMESSLHSRKKNSV